MKKIIVLLFIIVLPIIASSQDNCYMDVRFFTGAEDKLSDMGMVNTYTCDREAVCEGIMYMTKDMIGITSGSQILDIDSTLHEVHFSLVVEMNSDKTWLVGNIYSMFWEPTEDYMITAKKDLKQEIRVNRAELIRVGSLTDKTPLWMKVKISGYPSKNKIPEHPVILKTVVDKAVGENLITNSLSEIHDKIKFQTSSSYATQNERASLQYQVLIHIDSLPASYDRPFTTSLKLIRRYNIMRRDIFSNRSDTKENYESSYAKIIELQRGKTIKIVFPPDSPSAHEFQVTDTLIISP